GTMSTLTATLENSGSIAFKIMTIDNVPSFQFGDKGEDLTGLQLGPAQSHDINVTFIAATPGAAMGTIVVHVDDDVKISLNVKANAVARKIPNVTLQPLTIDFGTVQIGQNARKTVTFSNNGTADGAVQMAVLGSSNNPPGASDAFTLASAVP